MIKRRIDEAMIPNRGEKNKSNLISNHTLLACNTKMCSVKPNKQTALSTMKNLPTKVESYLIPVMVNAM